MTRYSATQTPEFVKHRRFSDEMVRRYLASYYVFDPFYASWRRERRLGIMPLKRFADDEAKRGQYIAGFLAQSEICDEVGIMLADGGDWCLGIFLDRSTSAFKDSEIALLDERLPVFEALHALDIKARGPGFFRTSAPTGPAPHPGRSRPSRRACGRNCQPARARTGAAHPRRPSDGDIAERLGITVGTVKNHRRRIYEKLDITTERELFLQFFQHRADR